MFPTFSFVADIYTKITGPGCSNVVFVAVIKHSTSTFTQENKNQTRVPCYEPTAYEREH